MGRVTKDRVLKIEPIIVGIGASAGGLEALQEFVKNLPDVTGCAFVIAQHLSPTYKSMMVDLLSRETKKKIVPVVHGMEVQKEMIYITPPNHDITVSANNLYLKQPLSQIGPKPSINIFFESLALEKKEKAIGIILSGTGSDGSHGIRAIKAEGGITMTQTPESAKYDGMVVSAINTGNIDFILPINEMVQEIENIYQYSIGNMDFKEYEQKKDYLTEIFNILKVEKKVDFSNYKLSTIRRRLSRRMVALKIISFQEYISYLKTHKEEVEELYKDLLIGVTYFFRDADSFAELGIYLKDIVKQKTKTKTIRIWIVACSTGEEAYTFAIMLHDILGVEINDYNIQIFATDIDDNALEIARKGKYPEASLQNISQEFKNKYFIFDGEFYTVIKPIREMILFSHHDIIQSPPFLRIDMISCRNVLIYFNQSLQEKLFPIFHYALNQDGILFLGKSETIGRFGTLFSTIDKKHKIYKSQITKNKLKNKFSSYTQSSTYELPANNKVASVQYTIEESARDTIVDVILPNSVVINTNHDLLFFQKELFPYLKISPGNATFNVFKMIDEQLNLELRSVVHGAIKDKTSKKSRFIRFDTNDKQYYVQIIVTPLLNFPDKELYLISFIEEKRGGCEGFKPK